MNIYRLTVRYPSGIVASLCFASESVAHGYYHTRVKPNHRNPPAFIIEVVEVYESTHTAPPEANITKI